MRYQIATNTPFFVLMVSEAHSQASETHTVYMGTAFTCFTTPRGSMGNYEASGATPITKDRIL